MKVLLYAGALLHLAIVFGPSWYGFGLAPWNRLELGLLALGLTLFYVADSRRAQPFIPRAQSSHDRSAIRLAYGMGLGLLLTFWCALIEYGYCGERASSWQMSIGALLMLAGSILRRVAVRTLGDSFVTEVTPAGDHQFIEKGIYTSVRHPSETAIILVVVGAAVTLGSRVGFVWLALVLFPLIVFRLRLEDQQLAKVYGERYADYARRIPLLIPRIWHAF